MGPHRPAVGIDPVAGEHQRAQRRTDDEAASFEHCLGTLVHTLNVSVLYVTDVLLATEQVRRPRARGDRSGCANHHNTHERHERATQVHTRQCAPAPFRKSKPRVFCSAALGAGSSPVSVADGFAVFACDAHAMAGTGDEPNLRVGHMLQSFPPLRAY